MASMRALFTLMALLLAALPAWTQELPAEVDAALARARIPRDAFAAVVMDASGELPPKVLHRADVPVNPASIAKLATTFAALEILGPGWRWRTPVFIDGAVRGGVLEGNVYVQGLGDPKLVLERVWLLLRRLQGAGIRSIAGDIVLDRTAFNLPPGNPASFDGEPLRPYNAAPDALLLNFRSIILTFTPMGAQAAVQVDPPLADVGVPVSVPIVRDDCGDWRAALKADFSDPLRIRFAGGYPSGCGEAAWPVAYADPAAYSARMLAGMWQQMGGTLGGHVREGRVPAASAALFEAQSPTLPEVIRDINKFSNNVMAQQVFLTLGLQAGGPATYEISRDALRRWWRERFPADVETPVFDNGSGLSRNERITAAQLARLLRAGWASPVMPEFVASLPLAGVDGTLRRTRGTSIQGIAHLKTGSLKDVSGVAGYVEGPGGRRRIVVAIVNHPQAAAGRAAIDALVAWAAREP